MEPTKQGEGKRTEEVSLEKNDKIHDCHVQCITHQNDVIHVKYRKRHSNHNSVTWSLSTDNFKVKDTSLAHTAR